MRVRHLLVVLLVMFGPILGPRQTAEAEEHTSHTAGAAPAESSAVLNGTWWAIELEPLYTTTTLPAPLKDTLVFKNGKVASALLAEDAFPSAPFTMSRRDGLPAWEATHASQRGGMVFWEGQVRSEGRMTGSFSRHPLDGQSVFCTFIGHQINEAESNAGSAP